MGYQAYYVVQGYTICILLEGTNNLKLTTLAVLVAKCRGRYDKP